MRNQALNRESHQRDKHLGCSLCKILGTILEKDERRTSTNRPEDKKINDYAYDYTFERFERKFDLVRGWVNTYVYSHKGFSQTITQKESSFILNQSLNKQTLASNC